MRSFRSLALLPVMLLLPAAPAILSVGCAPSSDEAETSSAEAISAPVLPFIADDYPRALAEAKDKRLPLFIESWAPW